MQTKTAFVFVLAAISASAFAAASAPVNAVVLYPGGASVTRNVHVAEGATEVVVAGLPTRFSTQTLHIDASAGIRLGEITTRDIAQTEAADAGVAELEAKLQLMRDQQAALDAELKATGIVTHYLEHLNDGADKQHGALDGKSLAGLVDTLGRAASDTLAKSVRLETQKRELGKKIDALERDLKLRRADTKSSRTLTVHMRSAKAGALSITYQTSDAEWQPGYRATLDSSASRVALERLASISQDSGEDWNNIKLTISTNRSRASVRGPDAQPWLLGYVAPPQPGLLYAPVSPAPGMQQIQVTGSNVRAKSRNEEETYETEGALSTEFEVPGRITLHADGREVSIALAREDVKVRQYLRVVPRVEPSATLVAEADHLAGAWPAGNVQLFRDGNYVGATEWNPSASEHALFAFGRDDLVRVARHELKGKSGSTGFFEKQGEHTMADEFTVTNGHASAVDVLVLEAAPVSTASEISVKTVFAPKPSSENWEQRRGVAAWTQTLGAGETAKFGIEYRLEYPKTGTVTGRRW